MATEMLKDGTNKWPCLENGMGSPSVFQHSRILTGYDLELLACVHSTTHIHITGPCGALVLWLFFILTELFRYFFTYPDSEAAACVLSACCQEFNHCLPRGTYAFKLKTQCQSHTESSSQVHQNYPASYVWNYGSVRSAACSGCNHGPELNVTVVWKGKKCPTKWPWQEFWWQKCVEFDESGLEIQQILGVFFIKEHVSSRGRGVYI